MGPGAKEEEKVELSQGFDQDRAERYDRVVEKVVENYPALLNCTAWSLRAWLPCPARILVVGAGTGNEILRLAEIGPDWTFVGIDPSLEMIDKAAQKIDDAGLASRVHLVCGDVSKLTGERFDAATCLLVSHFIPTLSKRRALFRQIRGLLSNYSPLIISELVNGEKQPCPWYADVWSAGAINRGMREENAKKMLTTLGEEVYLYTARATAQNLKKSGYAKVTPIFQSHSVRAWLAETPRGPHVPLSASDPSL